MTRMQHTTHEKYFWIHRLHGIALYKVAAIDILAVLDKLWQLTASGSHVMTEPPSLVSQVQRPLHISQRPLSATAKSLAKFNSP